MSYTLKQLRAAPDEELIRFHDQAAESTHVGVNYYLEELRRRQASRETAAIVGMTQTMTRLTWTIAALTLVNVLLAAVPVVRALLARRRYREPPRHPSAQERSPRQP